MTGVIAYSHEVALDKPDRGIYALTCQRLSVQPAEAIFLDDAEQHVISARDFGLHGILFKNNAQAIAGIQACLMSFDEQSR